MRAQLGLESTVSAEDFLAVDDGVATEEMMTDDEIVAFVTDTSEGTDSGDDDSPVVLECIVTAGEAALAAHTAVSFLESVASKDPDFVALLHDQRKILRQFSEGQQSLLHSKKISDFFTAKSST